jgi:16S rRNA (adenine1518-N6/adenine1519-N6)-dimethyltransferase
MRKSRRHALGQHFLKNPRLLAKLVSSISLGPADTILEVGAGEGHLTALLAKQAGRVIAIEKDPRITPRLKARKLPNVEIIEADVLQISFRDVLPVSRAKVVGNLPYSIATSFLYKIWEEKEAVLEGHFLIQKEVAMKICAEPGIKAFGPLSLLLQNHFVPRILFTLGPGAFTPPPRVDSAFIRLTPRKRPLVAIHDEAGFRDFLQGLFQSRRKTLGNCLKRAGMVSSDISPALRLCGVDERTRPEQIDLIHFACLFHSLWGTSPKVPPRSLA